jgi:hypothetical protein
MLTPTAYLRNAMVEIRHFPCENKSTLKGIIAPISRENKKFFPQGDLTLPHAG